MADEEDVALSALNSFFSGLRKSRFPLLSDRDDLWHLLIVITHRKARRQREHELRKKNGGGEVLGESATLVGHDGDESPAGFAQFVSREPTPEFVAMLAEEFELRLGSLPEELMRRIAELKFQHYQNNEIAEKLDCSLRTVVRKLQLIRKLWHVDGVTNKLLGGNP
jgi:DNA-directed RNA polymerase specialized sigma24 family protein